MREEQRPGHLSIHLLGRPRLEVDGGPGYRYRSRKSWAVLAFLLLGERAPTRSQLAGLLFSEADDPLRALRWSLAEIRRGLGTAGALDGDPVQLTLRDDTTVDTTVLVRGHWTEAVRLPGLGMELMDGFSMDSSGPFESWLLSQRRRLTAASESILHEAATGLLARGDHERALDLAVRASVMSPLDENHQALVIRLYRLMGDDAAAQRQYDAWSAVADRELGAQPGAAVVLAARARRRSTRVADAASIHAVTEAAAAAVSAGALSVGLASFETAVHMADEAAVDSQRVDTRLVLAEALIHTQGGLDEAGVAFLTEAEGIAIAGGDLAAAAGARAELGYVDFLRARYDRAQRSFEQVINDRVATPSVVAKAMTYLGSTASDLGEYPRAVSWLRQAIEASRELGEPRRAAFALAMLGRVSLLRGDPSTALTHLNSAVRTAEAEHWLSFVPWPQALLGQALRALGERSAAADNLEQAFARACQIGDPCWEGISALGLALLAQDAGEPDRAMALLTEARSRSTRYADPYVWLDVRILDAACELGRRQDDPRTPGWVEEMQERASRSGMRELTVRALAHGAMLGRPGDAVTAELLAADIDNPELAKVVAGLGALSGPRP